ncbi:hypothetical protein HZF02_17125 [Pseudomonas yamanorum]|nr:hypothetical protein HZF02_17125 [Pseudomonas yamanorum]
MTTENQSPEFELNGSQPARRVLAEMNGDDPAEYADWDVELTSDKTLDMQWTDEDPPHAECGCLRDWLAEATEPTYLMGTE